ncbi:MAG: saccharopine dehydrogenase NADP-binding domain-containing protein [Pseudomonadota bacterium]
MDKVIVLGGAGAVGRVAARTLASFGGLGRVVVADRDVEAALAVQGELGPERMEVAAVDVTDAPGLRALIQGARVVLNCTGPYYRFARPVLEACLDERVDYVDVCDDVDATCALLELAAAARAAGVRALIGMGNSPGITNLLGRLAADLLLQEVEAIDIYHAHGGERFEGPGVVAHRLHGMGMDIPVFLDGALETVRFFEPEGIALRERVDFHLVGRDVHVYPYPHPEQITMPRHIRCRQVTNRGTVLPDAYFTLTTEVARLGLTGTEPIAVGGSPVVPRDFAIAWLLGQRERLLREPPFGPQRGCTKVVVRGLRKGEPTSFVFSLASTDQALGEGTGIPAAMGVILMLRGEVKGPGVLPPEAAIAPLSFLALVKPVLASTGQQGNFQGVLVERIRADGSVEKVDLPF